ncbi:hypothetical protein GPECTOR_36g126 [Gonium pectorale]|uniref:Uncharacterized protein n=1 Tax=Gonium pectorale TaxID=33097 RepID=A0A150GBR3_GONPE|nr:hypothetical protein GPECTOR_36g126 [Gonium pectorale]|eukprot:KXZ47274.1 hypothetical protein GPECTOR_36g126 [Gonium pectorale]
MGASLADAGRTELREGELCGFTWRLSFKSITWFGPELASMPIRRHFHPNHTLTAPPDDPLWGNEEPQRHYWYFRPGPTAVTVLQVNTYPCLTVCRTPDWGWELENAVVRLTIDWAAGPNPGLPPDHPAAAETMTLEDIRERFHFAALMQDLGQNEFMSDDETEEEGSGSGSGESDSEGGGTW